MENDPTICKCGSESLTLKTISTEWFGASIDEFTDGNVCLGDCKSRHVETAWQQVTCDDCGAIIPLPDTSHVSYQSIYADASYPRASAIANAHTEVERAIERLFHALPHDAAFECVMDTLEAAKDGLR